MSSPKYDPPPTAKEYIMGLIEPSILLFWAAKGERSWKNLSL